MKSFKFRLSFLLPMFLVLFSINLLGANPTASISNANVIEGDAGTTILVFDVNSTGNSKNKTLDYNLIDVSATVADNDYVLSSGTVKFLAHGSTETISITINSDLKIEQDETFDILLSNPSPGLDLGVFIATGTITNDDNIPSDILTPENTTAITTLLGQGDFTIIGGVDSDKLSITNSGILTFNTSPDYEHPTSDAGFNTYTINVKLSFDPIGEVTKTVNVSVTDVQSDLAVTQSASANPVLMTSEYFYDISVTNNGPDTSEGITVKDYLPANSVYNGYVTTDWACSFSAGVLTCDYDSNLTANSSAPDIKLKLIAPNSGAVATNRVVAFADTGDNDPVNNSSDLNTTLTSNASDIKITLTAPSDVNKTGDIDYVYKVENLGSNAVKNVQFTHTLDSNLTFVSIDISNMATWRCSTGSVIICDYIGTFSNLAVGYDSGTITVKTRAPNDTGTVNASVSVHSAAFDPVIANNTATKITTIGDGSNSGGETGFSKYLQYNVFGDLKMLTGANLNYSGTDPVQTYNDNVDMKNRLDGDSSLSHTIFNSSKDTLDLNSSYEIVWAGLYWQGRSQTSDDGWDNSNYDDHADGKDHMNQILLKTPTDNDYKLIVANNLNSVDRSASNTIYGCFADITKYVDSNETGSYSVANIVSTEGTGGGGNYGGWTILMIYKDPSTTEPFKNISVFNGFAYINDIQADENITISGFVTPDNGTLTSSMAYFAGDGDPADGGSAKAQYNNTGAFEPVYGNTNLLNSFSTILGTPGNKTYGIDADLVTVDKYIYNGQTSATFAFDAGIIFNKGTPSESYQRDYYTLNMFAFSTDMYTPLINDMNKTAKIDGNDLNTSNVIKGATITYTINFENHGTGEDALEVEIFDDFILNDLTDVLDVNNFDATSIHLSNLGGFTSDTDEGNITADCGYDVSISKVWCRLDRVANGESYEMRFDIDIKDTFDDNTTDLVNTAYSNYKNATTGDYMEIVELDGVWYGGASNAYNAGKIGSAPTDPALVSIGADVMNNYSGSGAGYSSSIYTKIAKATYFLKAIYLGDDATPKVYPGSNQSSSLTILYKLADMSNGATCDAAPTVNLNTTIGGSIPVVSVIDPGEMIQASNNFVMGWSNTELAKKDLRIKYKALDMNSLIDSKGINCANQSSDGVVKGIPSCLITNAPSTSTAGENYKTVFGQDAFDNCYAGNGKPCYASNGGYGDAPYDNEYGCFECSIGAQPFTCSNDNFSIRPKEFEVSTTDATTKLHWPKLLRSGHDYNLTLTALDDLGGTTTGYTQSKSSLSLSESNVTAADLSATVMNGILSFATGDFNITNGVSANNAVDLSFNDVANVRLKVVDSNWTIVDKNDGTPHNCDGTWICSDDDIRFIVDHFDINETNLTNVDGLGLDGNYTYMSDINTTDITTYAMSAKVQITISAKNEDGNVTKNFRSGSAYYENNVSLSIVAPIGPQGNAIVMPDTTVPLVEIPYGFTTGIKTVAWNELDTNASKALFFNYTRTVNTPLNPFRIDAANVTVRAQSTYTQVPPTGAHTNAIIRLPGGLPFTVEDGNATFVYGRTHASRQRVEGNTTNPPVNIYFESFCFGTDSLGTTCTPALLNNFSPRKIRTDDVRWFVNEQHNVLRSGTIGTVIEKNGAGLGVDIVNTTTIVDANPSTATITYGGSKGYPYATTMENTPASWLVYDKDDTTGNTTTINSFSIEFGKTNSNWSGTHDTNTTTNSTGSVKSSRRSQW